MRKVKKTSSLRGMKKKKGEAERGFSKAKREGGIHAVRCGLGTRV